MAIYSQNVPSWNDREWNEKLFPNFEETPEKVKKTPKYCKSVLESAYYQYKHNRTDVGASMTTYFDTLRLFGKGKQPEARYKTYFSADNTGMNSGAHLVTTDIDTAFYNTKDYHLKGWMNVNWKVVSLIPNLKTMLQGHFVNVDFDVRADAIDVDSGAEQEDRMYRYYVKATYGNILFNSIRQQAGLQPEIVDYIPKQGLEKLKAEGGFKTPYSTEHEKLLLHTENISEWDRILKPKALQDAEDLSHLFAYAEYDKETCKVKWRYADPKDVIMQYSRYSDYKDVDWGGLMETRQVSEVKAMRHLLRDEDGNQCTEEDFKQMVYSYRGYSSNPSELEWESFGKEITDGAHTFDGFKIPVMKLWWKDVVYDKKLKYTTKAGKTRYYPYDDTVKKLGKRREIKSVRRRMVYQCSWIVGSKWVFDYGEMPNQPREPYYKPLLPIVGVKLNEQSITERLIPISDTFQIAWLKLQNAIAIAAEDGYALNISMLANVGDTTGGSNSKLDVFKIIQFWRQNGLSFYKNPSLGMQQGGSPLPIQPVPGGLEQMFTKYLTIMDWCYREIEVLTGLSPVALGASPAPNQAVGTTEMALSASNKALDVLIDAIRRLKENLAQVSSPMIQLAIKNDPKARREYAEVIGEEGIELLRMARSVGVRYGIRLDARPSDREWMEIMELAKSSFQRRSPEVAGINEGQYLWIIERKNAGANPKEIRFQIMAWIEEDRTRIQKNKERLVQMQTQGNQQTAQVQGQVATQTEQAKLKTIVAEINEKMKADIALENVKHSHVMEQKRMELNKKEDTAIEVQELKNKEAKEKAKNDGKSD